MGPEGRKRKREEKTVRRDRMRVSNEKRPDCEAETVAIWAHGIGLTFNHTREMHRLRPIRPFDIEVL